MSNVYRKADEMLKTLERFQMSDYGRSMGLAEMEPTQDGEWVKFEDVRAMLYTAIDEALHDPRNI